MKSKIRAIVIGVFLIIGLVSLGQASVPAPREFSSKRDIHFVFSLENRLEKRTDILNLLLQFEQGYPEYNIVTHFMMQDNECVIRATALAEKGGAVVAGLKDENAISLSTRNKIIALDPYIESSKPVDLLQRYDPYAMPNSIYNGYLWSLPYMRDSFIAYMRPAYLASLQIEGAFLTLSDCKRWNETNDTFKPIRLGTGDSSMLTQFLCQSPMDYRAKEIQRSQGYLQIVSTQVKDLQQSFQSGLLRYESREGRAVEAFAAGEIDILLERFSQRNSLEGHFDFPIATIPFGCTSNRPIPPITECFYLMASSPQSESDAWQLIDFLTEENPSHQLANLLCSISLTSSADSPSDRQELGTICYDNYSPLAVYDYPKIDRMLENYVMELSSNIDTNKADQELAMLQKQIHIILESYMR